MTAAPPITPDQIATLDALRAERDALAAKLAEIHERSKP